MITVQIAYEHNPKEYPVSVHLPYYRNSGDLGCYYHWHELIEIYYVLEGGVRLLAGGSSNWIRKGEVGVINWCEPHRSLGFEDGTVYCVVKLDIHSKMFPPAVRQTHFNHFLPGNDAIHAVVSRMVEEASHPDKETHHINLGYAVTLMGLLCRANKQVGPIKNNREFEHIRNVFTYIHEHYAEKFSLQDLADELGISKSHMCRIFMEHTGITINRYLNQTRCDSAVHLISNGYSVGNAGLAVGFADYNYFSRVFKKIMGYSPSDVKKTGISSSTVV